MTTPDETGIPLDNDDGATADAATKRKWMIAIGSLTAAVLAVVIGLLVVNNGDDDLEVVDSTTTTSSTTSTSSTSTSTSTTTTPPTTTTAADTGPAELSDAESATVVWPDPKGTVRFADPVVAARSFAVDLAGYSNPVLGEFQQGDSRSGEIELRAKPETLMTTVLIRQLSDESWWVLGAVAEAIQVEFPQAGGIVTDPMVVSGTSSAFEGTVEVKVYRLGSSSPIGAGFFTGGGAPDSGPFSDEISFTSPGAGRGVAVFFESSAEDGSTLVASAVPIQFGS